VAVLSADGENEGEEIEEDEEGVEGDGGRTRGPEATHQYRAPTAASLQGGGGKLSLHFGSGGGLGENAQVLLGQPPIYHHQSVF
jgi:hypothetical protein